MRQIVLDTETTGLDWRNGDRVIEIGCVELVNRNLTGRHFHVYLNPGRGIDAEAVAVHGITEEFLADKPKFADVAADFEAFVRDAELVIHNASFDVGFLDNEFELLGREHLRGLCAGVIDTLKLAKEQNPGKRPRSMLCATATRSTTPIASCTARYSTPSCWPMSIWP